MRTQTTLTYHFKVIQENSNTFKYYTTAKSITEDLGIPRSSIYKIMKRSSDTNYYTYPFLKIIKIQLSLAEIQNEIYGIHFRQIGDYIGGRITMPLVVQPTMTDWLPIC